MPHIPYKLKDGTPVDGTTKILKNCGWNTDALVGWAYNQGKEGKDRFETSKNATDIGTLVHDRIECFLGSKEFKDINLEPYKDKQIEKSEIAYDNFLDWFDQNKIEILKVEPHLVSERHKYGGTPDLIAKMNDKYTLIDWKSSRKVYSDYFLQLGGYACLIAENLGFQILDIHILRFSKTINGWDHIYRQYQDWMWNGFKCCLDLHNYKKIADEVI